MVIQALRHLGQNQVTGETVSRIRERLTHAERRQMEKDLPYAPASIAEIMRVLSAAEGTG